MSTLSAWSYTNTATVWPAAVDQYGQPSYGTPYTIACTWADTGDTQTDDNGTEFVPASTYWFEAAYGDTIPRRGDYIAKFSQVATDDPLQADGQMIKKVTSWDVSMFGAGETPDWAVFT